jgi:hypothetical protein
VRSFAVALLWVQYVRTRPAEQGGVLRKTRAQNSDEDTIPKPCGLGSREPARSSNGSVFVRLLFGYFPVNVR